MGQSDLGRLHEPHPNAQPNRVAAHVTDYWVYLMGPLVGAALAMGAAWLLREPGGVRSRSSAAQGSLDNVLIQPDKA